jgi:hypothetical protein
MEDTLFIKPDFSEVKDNVEAGDYTVRIVDSAVDQWQGKDGKANTVYINWTMETFNESEPKNNGRKIFHKTPLNGGGAFRLQEFYKAAMLSECPADGFDRTALHGKEVRVVVVDGVDRRTGQPTGFTDVKSVRPLT